jgi:4-diphosphocytidyl-2-C-methyl-D-erythritol kinase
MIPAHPVFPSSIHAAAKVNLFLHITGKRDDGYHLLDSGVVFTIFGDQITIDRALEDEICVTGPFANIVKGDGSTNICTATLNSFREAGGAFEPIRIIIEKNIPVGAGLGGGSANAAALLRYLNRHTLSPLASDSLYQLALRLGADVPVCLKMTPARMEGIGEIISPFNIRNAGPILLANPGLVLTTGEVFRSLTSAELAVKKQKPVRVLDGLSPCQLTEYGNNLLAPACRLMPEIANLLGALRAQDGADAVGMSGSGATCFAIHSSQATCEAAARQLLAKNIWAVSTKII